MEEKKDDKLNQIETYIHNNKSELNSVEQQIKILEDRFVLLQERLIKSENSQDSIILYQKKKVVSYQTLKDECSNVKFVSPFTSMLTDLTEGEKAKSILERLELMTTSIVNEKNVTEEKLQDLYTRRNYLTTCLSDLQYQKKIVTLE